MTLTFRKKPAESGIGEPREQPSMIARAPAAFGSLLAAAAILVAIASSERPAVGTAANETAASRSIPTSRHATAWPKADMSATTTRAEPTAPSSEPIAPSSTKDLATGICRQTWTYDSEGNVLTQVDRRGLTTVNTYDRENRLRTQAKAGLLLQTRDYDADGNLRQQTDALGRLSAFTVDKANRKIREDRAGLATEQWTYTPLGDVATHTDADHRTTTNTYTSRRFLASESLAGETSQYTYDGAGHRLTHERPNGPASTWTYAYDGAGNLASVTDPDDHATAFGYDANNNRTRVTDANAHVTTFAYDERNRLTGKTYPGGDAWHWRYDGDNNRIRSEAPNGRVTDIAFDALNRPTRSTYVGAPVGEVQSTAFAYDGNGNVRTVTEVSSSGSRVETRDYDDFDRLVHAVDGDGRSLHYAYDDVGNRTRLTDPDGHDTVWTYNALNQNTRVTIPGMGTTTLGYAPSGRLTEISRPDGSISEHTYFDNGRLQSIRHTKAGATLARYDYVYDPNGNRTEQRELNGATTGETTQSTRYVYDDADRLVEVKEPNRTTTYALDPVGNRVHESVVDGNTTAISQSTLTYNDRDQLTNRSDPIAGVDVVQTWDANGNLATQTVNGQSPRVYAYDARDRLVGLTLPASPTGPATLAFAYHADGLRREKTDGTTTTRYRYDGQSLLAETNTLGNTLRQFHYSATQLVAQTQAGATPTYRHVLLDALRSPVALLDPTGIITARTSYDAFGEIRAQLGTTGNLVTPNRDAANAELASTDQQPIGFTGYLKDSESGLYYAKARYYDPATARFTTEDPEAGKDLEPPSLHRYLYAYANPTAYTDPTGRWVWDLFGRKDFARERHSMSTDTTEQVMQLEGLHNAGIGLGGIAGWSSFALSGGVAAGASMTLGEVALYGGTGAAFSTSEQYVRNGDVDPARLAFDTTLSIFGGRLLQGGLASPSTLVRGGTQWFIGGLSAVGSYQGGHTIYEGIAEGNPSKTALGLGEFFLGAAGTTAVATDALKPRPLPSTSATSTESANGKTVRRTHENEATENARQRGEREPPQYSRVVFSNEELKTALPPSEAPEPIVLGPYAVATKLPDGRILRAQTIETLESTAEEYGGKTLQDIKGFTIEKASQEIEKANKIVFYVPKYVENFSRTNQEMELIQGKENLRKKTVFVIGEMPEPHRSPEP